jgi:hypothetical protein
MKKNDKKTISIVCFYPRISEKNNLIFSPAAVAKINYLIDLLIKNGHKVNIISSSWRDKKTLTNTINLFKSSTLLKISFVYSFFNSNFILKFINFFIIHFQLFFLILKNAISSNKIIFYHSTFYFFEAKFFSLFFGNKAILEVEEFYSNISNNSFQKYLEKNIVRGFNKFILSTELFKKSAFFKNKNNYLFYYGALNSPSNINKIFHPKTKIIYIGNVDKIKGGCWNSVKLASHLNDSFEITLLPVGTDEEISILNHEVEYSNNINECKIFVKKALFGKELNDFLVQYDFGISLQNSDGDFNQTSFPSKILVYLSSKLKVVSFPSAALRASEISDLILFSDSFRLEEISDIIKNNNDKKQSNNKQFEKYCKSFESKFIKFIEI